MLNIKLSFETCPVGLVFNPADPDKSVEESVFAGWCDALLSPEAAILRVWNVIPESINGNRVLQHGDKRESSLLTGDDIWSDYQVTAVIRQFLATSNPNHGDEYNTLARTGVVFRQQTTRRFYFFGMAGLDDFVLYRRHDEEWIELGHAARPVDRARYYTLNVAVNGDRIVCSIDGEIVIECSDNAYPAGKAGIRTNTLARIESITVAFDNAGDQRLRQDKTDRAAESTRRRANCPRAVLWRSIATEGASVSGPGRWGAATSPVFYLQQRSGQTNGSSRVKAVGLDGEVYWDREFSAPLHTATTCDFSGDGITDIAGSMGGELVIVDGATGSIRHRAEPPPIGPSMGNRHARAIPGPYNRDLMFSAAQLLPAPNPRGLVLSEDSSDGANTLWGYNDRLELLWTAYADNPKFGHSTSAFDVNGDGCEEVLAGSHLFSAAGELIWKLEDSDYWDRYQGARHCDMSRFVYLHGPDAPPVVVMACGAEGLILAEGLTGRMLACRMAGHVQFVRTGNFRPDLPGLEIWTFSRHGNFGVTTLFDSHANELFTFQPLFALSDGQPVAWRGDGSHLLFMNKGVVRGIWDSEGYRVAEIEGIEMSLADEPQRGIPTRVMPIPGSNQSGIILFDHGSIKIYIPESA